MNRNKTHWLMILALLLLFAMACNLSNILPKPQEEAPQEDDEVSQLELKLTISALETDQAAEPEEEEEAAPTTAPEPTRTPQPSLTPAPTNTPAPVYTPTLANPGLITENDYYTEFQDLTGWYDFYVSPGARPEYEVTLDNRGMNIYVKTGDTYVYAIQEDLWYYPGEPVYVETEISTLEGAYDNNLGVVCRVNEFGWYEFLIRTNGYWDFYRYDEDQGYTYLGDGGSWNINMKHETNVVGMLCDGDEFTIYINGVETKTIIDDKFAEGGVGLNVGTLEYGGLDFIVHNFTAVNDLSLVGLQ
ncbi:MAG: hypothetical protein HPY85_13030 [Anaerolineae bacterium]|nr:hypothetical protein [Anaerolineae bacterium]